ncbi:MAG: undecaprenyl-phosphate glucose phosphotransferase, partial [Hyphomicrobium sp.]|nr:undecaprenyl-phosphate glucose phosphotransferase [Hyphomicrobium sp.]
MTDVAIVVLAGIVATFAIGNAEHSGVGLAVWAVLIALAATLELRRNWSYSIRALRRPGEQAGKIARSLLPVFCVAAGAGYLIGTEPFSPSVGLLWLAASFAVMAAARFALARVLDELTDAGRLV